MPAQRALEKAAVGSMSIQSMLDKPAATTGARGAAASAKQPQKPAQKRAPTASGGRRRQTDPPASTTPGAAAPDRAGAAAAPDPERNDHDHKRRKVVDAGEEPEAEADVADAQSSGPAAAKASVTPGETPLSQALERAPASSLAAAAPAEDPECSAAAPSPPLGQYDRFLGVTSSQFGDLPATFDADKGITEQPPGPDGGLEPSATRDDAPAAVAMACERPEAGALAQAPQPTQEASAPRPTQDASQPTQEAPQPTQQVAPQLTPPPQEPAPEQTQEAAPQPTQDAAMDYMPAGEAGGKSKRRPTGLPGAPGGTERPKKERSGMQDTPQNTHTHTHTHTHARSRSGLYVACPGDPAMGAIVDLDDLDSDDDASVRSEDDAAAAGPPPDAAAPAGEAVQTGLPTDPPSGDQAWGPKP